MTTARYYGKEIAELPVYVNGVPLKFDILETTDPALIAELDKCIAKGRGGVYSITVEKYAEELKKKGSGQPLQSDSTPRHSRQELSALHSQQVLAAVGRDQLDQSRFGAGTFAKPQDREHRPHNAHGLPSVMGPSGAGSRVPPPHTGPMPDPIEVPAEIKVFKPATAKMSEVMSAD